MKTLKEFCALQGLRFYLVARHGARPGARLGGVYTLKHLGNGERREERGREVVFGFG